jgi:hypothetical protein
LDKVLIKQIGEIRNELAVIVDLVILCVNFHDRLQELIRDFGNPHDSILDQTRFPNRKIIWQQVANINIFR